MTQPTVTPAYTSPFIAKCYAKIALINSVQIFFYPLSYYGLLTGGTAEYDKVNKLRSAFHKHCKKGPLEETCEEIYNLAKEQMVPITADQRITKRYSADDLNLFRKCIDDYRAIVLR